MVRWTLQDTLAFLLLLSLLLPSLLIMFIPSTFKRPVSSWKALNLRKTLLMASSVRLKPLNCSRLLTKLGYDATPFNQILKQNAKREMRLRLGKVTVADVLAAQPVTTNLLKFMRASIKMIGVSNLQSFIASMTQKLTLSD